MVTFLYLIRHASPPALAGHWTVHEHVERARRLLRPGDRIYKVPVERLPEIAEVAEKGEPPEFNREYRELLRAVIDATRRSRVSWDDEPRCRACGVEQADEEGAPRYLRGCTTCSDRASKHRQRARRAAAQLRIEVPA